MKLGLMPGKTVPATEIRELGFEALQLFYGWNPKGFGGSSIRGGRLANR